MARLDDPHNFNKFNESHEFDESFGTSFNPRVAVDPLGVEQFLGEILPAAARQENFIAGFFTGRFDDFDYDPNYDLAQDPLGHDPVFQAYPGALTSVGSAKQLVDVHRRLVQEIQDRAVLESAGAVGFMSALMAGLISPENLIPAGIAGAAIRNIAKHGGKYVARNIRRAAFSTSIQTGTAEAFLQRSQFTRTPTETAFAIGASAILGGTLGAVAGGLGIAAAKKALREHDALLAGPRLLDPVSTILRRVEDLDPELDLDVIGRLEHVNPDDNSEILRILGIPEQAIIRDPAGRIENVDMKMVDDIEKGIVTVTPRIRTFDPGEFTQETLERLNAPEAAKIRDEDGNITGIDVDLYEAARGRVPRGTSADEDARLGEPDLRTTDSEALRLEEAAASEAGRAGPEAAEEASLRSLGFDPGRERTRLRRPTASEDAAEIAAEQANEGRASGAPTLSRVFNESERQTLRGLGFSDDAIDRGDVPTIDELGAQEDFIAAREGVLSRADTDSAIYGSAGRRGQEAMDRATIDRATRFGEEDEAANFLPDMTNQGIPTVRVDSTDDVIAEAMGRRPDMEGMTDSEAAEFAGRISDTDAADFEAGLQVGQELAARRRAQQERSNRPGGSPDIEDTPTEDFPRNQSILEMHQQMERGRAEGEAQGINPQISGLRRATIGLARIGRQSHRRADRDPVSRASAFERIIEARARGENVLESFPMATVIDAAEGPRVIARVDVTTHMELAERYAADNELEFDDFLDTIVETGTIDLQGRNLEEMSNDELLEAFFHGEGAGRALMQDVSPEDAAAAVEVGRVPDLADPDTIRIPEDVENIDPVTRTPERAGGRPLPSTPREPLSPATEALFEPPGEPVLGQLRRSFARMLVVDDLDGVRPLDEIIEGHVTHLQTTTRARLQQFDDLSSEQIDQVNLQIDNWFVLLDNLRETEAFVDDLRRIRFSENEARGIGFREGFEREPSIDHPEPPSASDIFPGFRQGPTGTPDDPNFGAGAGSTDLSAEIRLHQAIAEERLQNPASSPLDDFENLSPRTDEPGDTPQLRDATRELESEARGGPPDETPPELPFREAQEGASTAALRDELSATPRLVQGASDAGSVDADGDFRINLRTFRDLISNERAPRDRARAAFQVTIKKAFGIEKLLTHLSPNLRVPQNSMSVAARRGHQELAETGFKYEGDDFGMTVPLSAENAIIGWNYELGTIIEELPRMWLKYRLGREPGIGDALKVGLGDVKARAGQDTSGVPGFRASNDAPELALSHNEFMERVGFAMRRSDQDRPHNGAEIPEVMDAAKMIRDKLFNPTKQDAIDLGMFTAEDADIKTAESYFTRVFNIRYLKDHELEFDNTVKQWLVEIMPEHIDQVEGPPIRYTREMAGDDAARIRQRILATPASRQPYDVLDSMKIGPAKALQRRAFSIPDDRIEDFLVNNAEDVVRFYVRTVIPDIEIARQFGDFKASSLLARGDGDEGEQPGSVWVEYQQLIDAAGSDADRARIIKQREADLRDLTAIRDILRGTYAAPADPDSLPVRARILANRFNYLIQGGTFVLSSIPDVARVVMTDGVSRVWGSALKPMFAEWNEFKLSTREARLAGVAWDTILNTRALNLMELGDDYGRGSIGERAIRRGADQFANLSLLSPWNTVMKQFAGVVVQARLGEAITEIDQVLRELNLGADAVAVIQSKSHKQLIAKLSNSGIPIQDVRKLAEQMRRAGVGTDDAGHVTKLWNMNTEAWDDMAMVKVMRGAIRREVDKIIVTPGAGDRPLWMSLELGRLIGQYRSFSFAATQRVLIPGLQNLDRNFMNGTILAISMGMVATKLKNDQFSRGARDDLRYWITEGIDASGVTGILANFNQDISTLTRGKVRMGRLIGAPNLDQFTRRGFVSILGGPTVSTLHSISRVTQDLIPSILGGEGIRRRDVNAARRLFPTNNIFYLDSGYDALEKGTFNTIRSLQGD